MQQHEEVELSALGMGTLTCLEYMEVFQQTCWHGASDVKNVIFTE